MDLDVTVTGGGGYIQMPTTSIVAGGPYRVHFIHGDDAVTNGVLTASIQRGRFQPDRRYSNSASWNEVDFGTYPTVLSRSVLTLSPDLSAVAVHQLATASLSVGPSVVAVAVHQKSRCGSKC